MDTEGHATGSERRGMDTEREEMDSERRGMDTEREEMDTGRLCVGPRASATASERS